MTASKRTVLPDCAASFATLTEQNRTISETLLRVVNKVFGNGKPGLDKQTEDNSRAIQDLTETVKGILDAQKLEREAKEKEAKEKRADNRRFGLAIASAIITSLLAIVESVLIAVLVAKIAP